MKSCSNTLSWSLTNSTRWFSAKMNSSEEQFPMLVLQDCSKHYLTPKAHVRGHWLHTSATTVKYHSNSTPWLSCLLKGGCPGKMLPHLQFCSLWKVVMNHSFNYSPSLTITNIPDSGHEERSYMKAHQPTIQWSHRWACYLFKAKLNQVIFLTE